MRGVFLCVMLIVAAVPGQGQTVDAKGMQFRAHAVVPGTTDLMKVLIQGDILYGIGGDTPCKACGVIVRGDSAATRGPIKGELADRPGSLTFSAVAPTGEIEVSVAPASAPATPRYTVRGLSVRISRDARGVISVEKLR